MNVIKVQILGLDNHDPTRSLRHNVLNAVEKLNIIIRLEEIEDIDEFLSYDLYGIPAMTINGQLVFQQQVPSVECLVNTLHNHC